MYKRSVSIKDPSFASLSVFFFLTQRLVSTRHPKLSPLTSVPSTSLSPAFTTAPRPCNPQFNCHELRHRGQRLVTLHSFSYVHARQKASTLLPPPPSMSLPFREASSFLFKPHPLLLCSSSLVPLPRRWSLLCRVDG